MSTAPGLRTPLGRAKGLGAAHTGVGGFIVERATSVALVFLSLWAVWAAIHVAPTGYAGAVAFLRNPINATLAVLTVAISYQHTQVGMQVILEDYVSGHLPRLAWLLVNSAVALLGGALAVVALLKVAFSAA